MSTIQIKRGAGAPAIPLLAGEPAFDTTNKNLYVGDGATNTMMTKSGTLTLPDTTTLTVDAIADGEFLKRSGSTIISAAVSNVFDSIDVDTINEKTAANGVAIDGVRAKDYRIELTETTAPSSGSSILYANSTSHQLGYRSYGGLNQVIEVFEKIIYRTTDDIVASATFLELSSEWRIPVVTGYYYYYEFFFPFYAYISGTNYGFILSLDGPTIYNNGIQNILGYTVQTPITATTSSSQNYGAYNQGTVTASIPTAGIATLCGYGRFSASGNLTLTGKCENVSFPVSSYRGAYVKVKIYSAS